LLMDAQDKDLGPELTVELLEESIEAAPPEAFYMALRNALWQLQQAGRNRAQRHIGKEHAAHPDNRREHVQGNSDIHLFSPFTFIGLLYPFSGAQVSLPM